MIIIRETKKFIKACLKNICIKNLIYGLYLSITSNQGNHENLATFKTKERQSANLEWAGDTIRACARASRAMLLATRARQCYTNTVELSLARLLALLRSSAGEPHTHMHALLSSQNL